mmetsp:Transcript_43489/g.83483  ORF Transcript_43489/g.83483 Transcript_43489/m.83483 type:complete len:81 (-) Transcript_43489:210-452(-)
MEQLHVANAALRTFVRLTQLHGLLARDLLNRGFDEEDRDAGALLRPSGCAAAGPGHRDSVAVQVALAPQEAAVVLAQAQL